MIEAAAMDVTLRVAMFAIPTRRRTLVPARNEEIARLEEPYVPHEVSGIDL